MKTYLEIAALRQSHIESCSHLFINKFKAFRETFPELPDLMTKQDVIKGKMDHLLEIGGGLVALQGDTPIGYLMWVEVENFRNTDRKTAYLPEYAHGVLEPDGINIYQHLYRTAADQWFQDGCQAQAVTLLANDPYLHDFWFWNGFGMTVVDAIRKVEPLPAKESAALEIRKADLEDVANLVQIEIQHAQYYSQAPTLMIAPNPSDATEFAEILQNERNTVWLAFDQGQLVGYLRIEGISQGASSLVRVETNPAITGLYALPQYRGRGIGSALLQTAMQELANQGYQTCSVDFESINPDASNFWLRYFKPFCYSLIRVPEYSLSSLNHT